MKIKTKNVLWTVVLIIFLLLMFALNYKKISNIYLNKKAEKSNSNITFQVYSNENNILKILVTAKDEQNGIKRIVYIDENGNQKEIDCYGKTQIAMDYEVKQNGEYEFKMINKKDEETKEKLVVDDNYRNNLIPIYVSTEKDIDINGNVTIEFPESNNKKMYKIGKNGTWTEYKGEFTINSYDIIEKNLQNSDTKKVDIYAKMQDEAKNVVQIKKEIENIDVDIEEPQINIISVDNYSTLTSDGVINNGKVSINYDNREGILNYYSIDNGNTWIEYDNDLTFNNVTNIMAKSIKSKSGLKAESSKIINPSAKNAIGVYAYDNDIDTNYLVSNSSVYMIIDNSAIGKKVNILVSAVSLAYGMQANINFFDVNGDVVGDSYSTVYTTNLKMKIPDNAVKIEISVNQSYYLNDLRIEE